MVATTEVDVTEDVVEEDMILSYTLFHFIEENMINFEKIYNTCKLLLER